MRIPRELIDEIIDELDLSEEYDPKIADALKSCALVSTLFVRSCQTRLFARISVRDYERTTGRRDETLSSSPHMSSIMLSYRLSVLLSTSPHLATYIRTLDLCYNASTTEANFVPRILSAVTALHTLILTDHFCASFPLNSSTVAVFSLPTLRRVELRRYQFANPFELESLLSRAKCLKELTLSATFFGENFEHDRVGVTREAGTASNVTLEKLTLVRVDNDVVKPMLDLFTMVDIRHLKHLSIHNSPIMDLLRVNAHFIQTLSLGRAYATVSCRAAYLSDVPDSQIMAGTNHLSCLNLEADEIHAVLTLLPLLGALENLTALKPSALHFTAAWMQTTFPTTTTTSGNSLMSCCSRFPAASGWKYMPPSAISARLPNEWTWTMSIL
ncbi:hypothetical protein MVEN_01587600 [Mycena venus]|uniref:F-box domain-containing protein n=1 Tax=Mycena venus TaxID=2733690 RepID=A0A8H6XPP3_9AGAR|nr:hypothetical protein MVEN_01587600 [Mycena venus]